MFCGSEGLFGIALEVTLRLVPLAEATRTALAVFDSLAAAGGAVADVVRDGLLPVAMEIMDALAIQAAEASVKPGYPEGAALLIVELEGEREVVDADAGRLAELLRASGATDLSTTEDPAERALIWKGRKSAFSAVGWLAPDYLVQDGVVPRTRLGEALAEIGRMSEETGIRVANVFHAGDGNLHPLILFDGREPGALERAEALAGGHPAAVHRARGLDHRRARRRGGEARLPAPHVLRGRHGAHAAPAGRGRPRGPRQPRQGARARARARARVTLAVDSVEAVQEAVRRGPRVLPVGGGTKPALSTPPADDVVALDLSSLRGLVEYDPAELTLTALAGTPVAEVDEALAVHGQHLPFDPPLRAGGATLGGVVAAGTSGPGALPARRRARLRHRRAVRRRDRPPRGGRRQGRQERRRVRPAEAHGRLDGAPRRHRPALAQGLPAPARHDDARLRARQHRGGAGGHGAARPRAAGPRRARPRAARAACSCASAATPRRSPRAPPASPRPCRPPLSGSAPSDDAALWRDAAELAWMPPASRVVRAALTARSVVALEAALAADRRPGPLQPRRERRLDRLARGAPARGARRGAARARPGRRWS